ncbi:DNA polymerase [Aeromonas phage vB_AsaP_MQM1]|nr:DNA polymerase [Aeromonas phage vB_AsaP_MQM1]
MHIEFDFRKSPVYLAIEDAKKVKRYCFDIETNGLLKELTEFLCGVIIDIDTGERWKYEPGEEKDFSQKLSEARWLVGHNIIGFDIPAMFKLTGWVPGENQVLIDTVILSRMYNPNLELHPDCPKKVWSAHAKAYKNVGPHTLMNLGYIVGVHKDSFGEEHDFVDYCPEMLLYCEQDVVTNIAVFEWLWKQTKSWSRESIACEMEIATYIGQQIRGGWFFAIEKADALHSSFLKEMEHLEAEVRRVFHPIYKPVLVDDDGNIGVKVPKAVQPRVTKAGTLSSVGLKNIYGEMYESFIPVPAHTKCVGRVEYHSGAFCPVEVEKFNLGSRQQIAERMQRAGWVPNKLTDKGNIIIDDEVLEEIADKGIPEGVLLQRYFKLSKLCSMVKGWIDAYDWDTKRIHGYVSSVGAVTSRMTHSNPNVAQVPAASTFEVHGYRLEGEHTKLVKEDDTPVILMGYSGSYKELKWHKGDAVTYYMGHPDKVVMEAEYLRSAGWNELQFEAAAEHGELLLWGRKGAWGADCRELFTVPEGYTLVGCDASGLELRCLAHYMDDAQYTDLILHGDIHSHNQHLARLPTRKSAKTFIAFLYGAGDAKIGSIVGGGKGEGKTLKARFLKGLPKLAKLLDRLAGAVESRGAVGTATVKAVDGRRVRIRSPHAALNSLLQSCGAVVCKLWLIVVMREVNKRRLDAGMEANGKDEIQLQVRSDQVELVMEICESAMPAVGEYLGFRCPLGAEAKSGKNWAETH